MWFYCMEYLKNLKKLQEKNWMLHWSE
jgi:hypothetical protein